MLNFLYTTIVGLGLLAQSFFGNPIPTQTFGTAQAFNPVGATSFTLAGAGVTASANTIQLTSFKTPNGQNLTMSNFGTIGFGAIDPQTNAKLEDVSFTGITQNANGSATLTGVSRGLSFVYPYTASTTLQYSHAGGATFILTNSAAFYGTQFAFLANDQTFTGINTFQTNPILVDGSATSSAQAASRAYVNSVTAQGAATSTYTTGGIGLLATGAQAAAGTYTLNSPYFLSSAISSSTWDSSHNNISVITKTNDGIANTFDPNFLPRASAINWSGNLTISGVLAATSLSTSTFSATTSMPSLNITGGGLTGQISRLLIATTTGGQINPSTSIASTTMFTTQIPGGVLYNSNGSNGMIDINVDVSSFNIGANGAFYTEVVYGGTSLFTISTTTTPKLFGVSLNNGELKVRIYGNNASNSVTGFATFNLGGLSFSSGPRTIATVDSTQAQTLSIVSRFGTSNSDDSFSILSASAKIVR